MTPETDPAASRHSPPLAGSIPALVTPMREDGSIDWPSFRALIDWHVVSGTNAIVVMGSTGETATATMEEHCELITVAINHADGRIPVIAGTGANSTMEAIELTEFARKAGAAAALSVAPYYNKPTQYGLFLHFTAIAEAVDIPLILYNVPSRTAVDMDNETVLRLAQIPNVAGVKDATGDIGRAIELMRQAPDDFALFSGDDPTAAALMLLGARGNISVTANVIPEIMTRLCAAARGGDVVVVREISRRIAPLNAAMFVETNPIPVKWALARMGKLLPYYRLPLTPLESDKYPIIELAMECAMAGDIPLLRAPS
ncbi:4-hydroxy-tetrahydrodipicolinate synthase [Rhizobium binxianense]